MSPSFWFLGFESSNHDRALLIWVLLVFMLVVGGIMLGFFTPTEAGAVGTFALILLAVVKRAMTFRKYVEAVVESLLNVVMIMMLIVGSLILGHFITATDIPQFAADWIVSLPLNRYVIMILICIIYEIGGSFIVDIEGIAQLKANGGQVSFLSDEESRKWVEAVAPVVAAYAKELVSKGYKQAEVDAYLAYVKERTAYWSAQEKERSIPKAY